MDSIVQAFMMNIILQADEKHCTAPLLIKHLHMCISQCSGLCMVLLKEKLLDSKESLSELNTILDKLGACSSPGDTSESKFMNEVALLKMEAANLLEMINSQEESAPLTTSDTEHSLPNIFEESSFKQRLNNLKQSIVSLSDKQHA